MSSQILPRKLGAVDSAAIVVGTVIGSALFIVPGAVARDLPSTSAILAVWTLSGLLSFFGALAYAELGAMMPATGGQYVYLRESFGPLAGFLCGWAFFLIIQSGGAATLAAGFSIYLSFFLPMPELASRLVAAALILILTGINYRGVESGAGVQRVFTFMKISGIALLIGAALFSGKGTGFEWTAATQPLTISAFGVAMIACLWAYEGWNVVSFVAGEVRDPGRNLPIALGVGVAAIVIIYVTANIAYLKVLSVGGVAASDRVAADAMSVVFGPAGGAIISLVILISIIGSINGTIMTSPRVYFAMAQDRVFFRSIAEVHPRFQTPANSIAAQGLWAALLAISGSYESLFSYVIFAAWIFYGMTVLSVVVLRRKRPELNRPYRMWGYPFTALLFAAISFGFVINTLVTTPGPSMIGLGLIVAGVPVYYIWKGRGAAETVPR